MERLESLGIIETLVFMYEKVITEIKETVNMNTKNIKIPQVEQKLLCDIVKVMIPYCQFFVEASESAIQSNFLSLALYSIFKLSIQSLTPLILEMIVCFVKASDVTRDVMWQVVQGPHILIALLNQHDFETSAKVFDTLVMWLQIDPNQIERYFCDSNNLNEIFNCMFNCSKGCSIQEFLHVLNSIKIIISSSHQLAKTISKRPGIIKKITKQLDEIKTLSMSKNDANIMKSTDGSKSSSHFYSQSSSLSNMQKGPYNLKSGHNMTHVLLELLQIIDLLIEKSKVPIHNFIKVYKLQNTLLQIVQIARSQGLVLIENLCEKLLGSGSSI